ncbi:peptidase [Pontibacillus yanchengensis]|uniref:Peptidase n=2 Tax=Pontibacillus yanchengensis TaxID=462910 RepID=A0A6I4ZUG8_9BACI|nr:C40 family peptidase [Pontibacillus yanchengensis]MYL33875.1 peptidase [Pontibacillus yanchengensis]MYL53900.1 peptidase [Pontibacillus yanchengensis]
MTANTNWVVQVPVATVWTSPTSAREIDEPGLTNPLRLKEWYDAMTYEPRVALCDDNLVQSQLLYGEDVLLLEEKDGWSHIIAPHQPSKKDQRGYPGWIPSAQLKEIEDDHWDAGPVALVTTSSTTLYNLEKEPLLELSYLTILPYLDIQDGFVKVHTPNGDGFLPEADVEVYISRDDIPKGAGIDIVAAGEKFIDLPYFWGGMSSYGYDCSGFSYNMHKANGYEIPRDASDQVNRGKEVPLEELQPGDLIYFAYEEGKGAVHHVGIYYGDGKMLHAPKTGKNVEVLELADTYYEKELCAARRFWEESS